MTALTVRQQNVRDVVFSAYRSCCQARFPHSTRHIPQCEGSVSSSSSLLNHSASSLRASTSGVSTNVPGLPSQPGGASSTVPGSGVPGSSVPGSSVPGSSAAAMARKDGRDAAASNAGFLLAATLNARSRGPHTQRRLDESTSATTTTTTVGRGREVELPEGGAHLAHGGKSRWVLERACFHGACGAVEDGGCDRAPPVRVGRHECLALNRLKTESFSGKNGGG